jgi:uncharacterized phage-associated protein
MHCCPPRESPVRTRVKMVWLIRVDFLSANHYPIEMLNSVTVANRLLANAKTDGRTLTPLQILKLVYLAHAWSLGLYARPLITDEIQAWQYGPVIPSLYDRMKDYRGNPVTAPLPTFQNESLSPSQSRLIEQVNDLYGDMTGPELSRITHAPGSPWSQVYEPGKFGIPISNDIIRDHYKRLAETYNTDAPTEP